MGILRFIFTLLSLLMILPKKYGWQSGALQRFARTNQLLKLQATPTSSPPTQSKDVDFNNLPWAADDDGWGEEDAEDMDFLKFLQDEYDSISTNGRLSFDQFIEWEECQDILADEFLTLKDFLRIWNKVVGSNTQTCDFEGFLAVNEEIDASV